MSLLGFQPDPNREDEWHRAAAGALALAEFLLESRQRLENIQTLLTAEK